MKRKAIRSVLLLVLAFALLSGCASGPQPSETAEAPAEAAVQETAAAPVPTEAPAAETPDAAEEEAEAETVPKGPRVMVVVFSGTGHTRRIAQVIADGLGTELQEIVPAEPYTEEDLNYNDSSTRATVEQNDPAARPAIAEPIDGLDDCDILFLGYPIWWGQEPRILDTFAETYDLSGITVIPFCTSGSSDIGGSDDALAAQAGSGTWLQGRRFSGNVSEDALRDWISETGGTNMEKSLSLVINGTEVAVAWEDNESVAALIELASAGPLTVQMSMYGGFEQVGSLGTGLPRDDVQTTTRAGDIVLYSGNQIVVFYGSNSWAYTRLGHITDLSAEELSALLGSGDVTLTLSVD